MNTTSISVFVIFLVLVQENFCNVGGDVDGFFKAIPGEFKNAFDSLWKSIKKPFTVRRIGRGGRRRRRPIPTSTTSTETLPMENLTIQVTQLYRRIPLPVLPTPEWHGMDHWNLQQLPRYALTEGKTYEFRRRQISKWLENYIVQQPTRSTRSSIKQTAPPISAYSAVEPIRRQWLPVVPKTVLIEYGLAHRHNA